MKTLTLYLIGIIAFLPITSNSQILNKDSIAFVHSHGQIDENNPLSISLANTLYRISINAKNKKYPSFYGGAYIKNDSITLLIAQKVPYIELDNIIVHSCQRINLDKCNFSYRELLTVSSLLEKLFFQLQKKKQEIKQLAGNLSIYPFLTIKLSLDYTNAQRKRFSYSKNIFVTILCFSLSKLMNTYISKQILYEYFVIYIGVLHICY